MLSTLLALPLLVVPAPASAAAPGGLQDDLATLVAELTKATDDAEVATIDKVAALGTREACEALIAFYDQCGSVFVHDATLRALARFDGVEGAQQPALEKIATVASTASEPELRYAAVQALGGCATLGKTFLFTLVESPIHDGVREAALAAHVRLGDESDHDWYRELYQPTEDRADRAKRRAARNRPGAASEGPKEPHRLDSLRAIAFSALMPSMKDKEIAKAYGNEPEADVQLQILQELAARDHKDATKLSQKILENIDMPSDLRAGAAQIFLDKRGVRATKLLIEIAGKLITPEDLREAIGDLLAGLADKKTDGTLAKGLAKGKPPERAFNMRALGGRGDDRARARVAEALGEKEAMVRAAAARFLGLAGQESDAPALRAALEKEEDVGALREQVQALSLILAADAAWWSELQGMARGDDAARSRVAVVQLAERGSPEDRELFLELLQSDAWSARLIALDALVALRDASTVGPIVSRMGQESGRTAKAFGEALFQLTAQPFGDRADAWQRWYDEGGKGEALASPDQVAEAEAARAERKGRETSAVARFFGIPIESTRVIFVLDVSGSMVENLRGEYVGRPGEVRIERAKRELVGALKDLASDALFNILPFSSGVDRWRKEGIATGAQPDREAAMDYVRGLGAIGGTNIYDALEQAFEDPDVDTIVVLSDGEPTAGKITAPGSIRKAIQNANAGRNVVIHTVALGGRLRLLEWLAADSGGTYVKFDQ